MFIFGGYGGSGFARRDFNDIGVLDLGTWEWRPIECTGEHPDPRSGHQGVAVQDNVYIIGGWNSIDQFDNMYVLDTVTNVWTKPAVTGSFGPPRWNFSAVSVFAVPYWKVFVFGGNSGNLNDGGNPQGQYLNDMCVLETGSKSWTRPQVLGTVPCERGETPIVYDPRLSRLVMFGGWANRWFGDTYVCKVADVVGPPYSVESISPSQGPITGATRCTITGVGFRSGGNHASIRFACLRGFAETTGEVVNDTTIAFDTPNFEKYGATAVEGRVGVGGKSLTNSVVNYSFFAVASCETSIAFGPGVVSGCVSGSHVSVIIQSRDANGGNRICGMDEFIVTVAQQVLKKEREVMEKVDLSIAVADQDDGTYAVTFIYPEKGLYEVSIVFNGTFFGKAGHIRGSPFRVNVTDVGDSVLNELTGPLLMEYVRKQTKDSKDYSTNSLKSLKKTIPKDEVDGLIKVKEVLKDVEAKKDSIELGVDSCRAALMYLKNKQGGQVDKMIEQLDNSAALWADVGKQVPFTANTIIPLTKHWSTVIEDQIEVYNKEMAQKLKDFKTRPFWNDDISTPDAMKAMAEADKFFAAESDILLKQTNLVKTFDFPHLVKSGTECMEEMRQDLAEMKKLWAVTDGLQKFISETNDIVWKEMNTDDLDDGAKNQVKSVKYLHKCVRWSKAYKLADKISKDFLNTVPLISLLGARCMRGSHW